MKKLFKVALAALMTLSVAACSSNNGGGAVKGGTITVGAEELSGTFSPLYYSSAYDGYVVDLVYDKLFTYDYDGNLVPELAESMEVTDGGKVVSVKLKEGIKFSDESDFNAKDVEFTMKVLSDPSYTGRFIGATKYLVGYNEYSNPENTKEPEFPGIEVIDDYNIKFTFTEARNDNDLSVVSVGIVSDEQFKDTYAYNNTKPLEDAMQTPIGTGPYVLKQWESGTGASLARNEHYWGEGYEGITQVIIKPTKMETEFQELTDGAVDMINSQIEPKKIGPASTNENLELVHYPRAGMGFIAYNCARGATMDKAVRQALTFAFDRQTFVDSYYACKDCKDLDGVTIGYVPATFQNPASKMVKVITGEEEVEGLEPYHYDIEKAAKVLDDAGWKVGASGKREKDGQVLEIKVLAIQDHDILNTLIPMWQKEWGDTLKCDVKVATVDFNTLLEKVYSDKGLEDWSVFFMATSWTDDSMSGILSTFDSSYAKENLDNYSRLMDPALDKAMDDALTEMDKDAAVQKWIEAAKIVNDDCSQVAVYGNTYFDIYNKKIKNLKLNTLYPWTSALKDATIE